MTDYFHSLDIVDQNRYIQKLKLLNLYIAVEKPSNHIVLQSYV